MTHQILWRLEGVDATRALPDSLGEGLRLHLAHTRLTCVLMQIGARQQAYLVSTGCPGCLTGRCVPGCYGELLRRLLHARVPECTLAPLRAGLARRPYQRFVLGFPGIKSEPLGAELLTPWEEGRLALCWRMGYRQTLRCTALLAVGRAGPDPQLILRQRGWSAWALPRFVGFRLLNGLRLRHLPLPGRWSHAPLLLFLAGSTTVNATPGARSSVAGDPLPQGEDTNEVAVATPPMRGTAAPPPVDDQVLARWLRGVLVAGGSAGNTAADPLMATPVDEPDLWPVGPYGLSPHALARLFARIVGEPTMTTGKQSSQLGLTSDRLAGLDGISAALADALMVWLDVAGVLAEPLTSELRWRSPRPLATTSLEQIAERLAATPVPAPEAIKHAYGGTP